MLNYLKIRTGYKITENISVEEFLRVHSCCGAGWNALLRTMFTELFDAGWDGGVAQIKEKFGTLRVYLELHDETDDVLLSDILYNTVEKYERLSETTCEVCGADGELRTAGRSWIATNCDSCHDNIVASSAK